MTPQQDVRRQPHVRLAEKYSDAAPGTLISYGEIAQECGAVWPSPRVRAMVTQLRRHLLSKHCRATVTIRCEGLRLTSSREHVGVAAALAESAARRAKEGLRVVTHVKVNELDPEGQRMLSEAQQQLASVCKQARSTSIELNSLGGVDEKSLPKPGDVMRKLLA